MSQRVGIFGGMFDPVHDGHVAVARHAVELLGLDRLLLVPCRLPNHRDAPQASGEQRLAMLRLATAEDPRLQADSIELDREGVSCTARTLAQIHDRLADAVLVLVLGIDAFLGLPHWRDPEKLFQLANFLVIARQKLPMDYHMAGRFGGRMAASPGQLFNRGPGQVLLSKRPEIDASSTAARDLLANDREAPLPAAVTAYIRKQGLYRAGTQ